MTAAKPLARYSATQERARERLPNRPSYTIQWDTTTCTHVGVADRLQLFQAMPRYDVVERREVVVQLADQGAWLQLLG